MISLFEFFGASTLLRPDMSGQRGGETKFPPLSREDDFPYGMQNAYGQPKNNFPGDNGKNPSYNPPTPRDTRHSSWEDVVEVLGSPMLLTKAYQGGQEGSALPGVNGSWSSGMGDWNADEESDEDLMKFGENLMSMVDLDRDVNEIDPPSEILVVANPEPFSQGLGKSFRVSRGGLVPKTAA